MREKKCLYFLCRHPAVSLVENHSGEGTDSKDAKTRRTSRQCHWSLSVLTFIEELPHCGERDEHFSGAEQSPRAFLGSIHHILQRKGPLHTVPPHADPLPGQSSTTATPLAGHALLWLHLSDDSLPWQEHYLSGTSFEPPDTGAFQVL